MTDEDDLRSLWLSRLMFNMFVGWAPETRTFEQFQADQDEADSREGAYTAGEIVSGGS